MPRKERAKQFAPFDALKGLQEALRIKEYQFERISKGDLPEEKIENISKILSNLEKNEIIKVSYYNDGHCVTVQGKAKLNIVEQNIQVAKQLIPLDEIMDIEVLDN